jgi:hypothetical protein
MPNEVAPSILSPAFHAVRRVAWFISPFIVDLIVIAALTLVLGVMR